LKFHKTAKAFFGNPCTKLAEILKAWRKGLEPASIPPFPLLP
jgi:hypothetical protein